MGIEIQAIASGMAIINDGDVCSIVRISQDKEEHPKANHGIRGRYARERFHSRLTGFSYAFQLSQLANPSDCMTWEEFEKNLYVDPHAQFRLKRRSQA
jgi:hypothetical protein